MDIIQASGKTHTGVTDEIWLPMYRGQNTHKISNYGRILSLKTNKMLRATINKNGNCYIYIYEPRETFTGKIKKVAKSFEVGWLVLMTFRINTHLNEMKSKHLDGDLKNNRLDNLTFLGVF
jgi:hypothetical protein